MKVLVYCRHKVRYLIRGGIKPTYTGESITFSGIMMDSDHVWNLKEDWKRHWKKEAAGKFNLTQPCPKIIWFLPEDERYLLGTKPL